MEKKSINIKGFEGLYDIYKDGRVYSYRKKRFLKPNVVKPHGYVKYYLTGHNKDKKCNYKWYGAHQLVASHFIGLCPEGMEINHIDHNKQNNHVSNLEYVTHAVNCKKSYDDNGRQAYWKGRKRGSFHEKTKYKMALAKHRPVLIINMDNKEEKRYNSIEDVIKDPENPINYRKMYNRIINNGGVYKKKGYNILIHSLHKRK